MKKKYCLATSFLFLPPWETGKKSLTQKMRKGGILFE